MHNAKMEMLISDLLTTSQEFCINPMYNFNKLADTVSKQLNQMVYPEKPKATMVLKIIFDMFISYNVPFKIISLEFDEINSEANDAINSNKIIDGLTLVQNSHLFTRGNFKFSVSSSDVNKYLALKEYREIFFKYINEILFLPINILITSEKLEVICNFLILKKDIKYNMCVFYLLNNMLHFGCIINDQNVTVNSSVMIKNLSPHWYSHKKSNSDIHMIRGCDIYIEECNEQIANFANQLSVDQNNLTKAYINKDWYHLLNSALMWATKITNGNLLNKHIIINYLSLEAKIISKKLNVRYFATYNENNSFFSHLHNPNTIDNYIYCEVDDPSNKNINKEQIILPIYALKFYLPDPLFNKLSTELKEIYGEW